MKAKTCIFLTASIVPQNPIGLKRNSATDREDDYYNALVFYLKLGLPIVFCDNSMYQSKRILDLVNKNKELIEYLNFKSQNSHLGKSHGEKEIFDYVHQNSETIKSSVYVVKVTGRLIVTNILEILNKLGEIKDFMISANISRNLSFSDSRFFIYRKEFYSEYLEPILKSQLNDWKRVYFEFCLAKSIHQLMVYNNSFVLLPIYPKYEGKNGSTNKSYNKSFFAEWKYQIYFRLKNYFFKHPI